MKITPLALATASTVVLALLDLAPLAALHTGFIGKAQAIVGRPLTPVSVAGVARRTTRRAVAVGATAAVATTAAASSAAAAPKAQPAAPAPPPPPPAPAPAPAAGAPLAVGTVVTALPPGCVSAPISDVEYYLCNGTYFRPGFQGNNLVYVVQKP